MIKLINERSFLRLRNLLLLIMFSLVMLSCKKEEKQDEADNPEPEMETVYALKVAKGATGVTRFSFPTTLIAENQIDLRTDISGRVERLLFKEGAYVKAGQPLYDIDKSRFHASYQKALAQVKIAEASVRKAELNAQRYLNLLKHDAIEKMTVDNAVADAQVAKAQLESDRADLKRVKTDLDYATVRAPFSGYIGVSEVRVGDLVAAGQTVLAHMTDKNNIRADLFVSEQAYAMISSGEQAPGQKPLFVLKLADGSTYEHYGQLSFIEHSLDARTASYRARLSFINPKGLLKPGMSASVVIEKELDEKEQQTAILIPQKALQERLGEAFVFLVDKDNKVKSQVIKTGVSLGESIVVVSGLNPGDNLLVEGIQKVKPGDKVDVKPYLSGK